jgi:hypothetical protein
MTETPRPASTEPLRLLSAAIPARDEEVVDDGSTDSTWERLA